MKAVILAGGLGTRLSEETQLKPKPLVEIGARPILWHIMKIYSHFGINEFVICCGYRGYLIKEYFSNFSLHLSDVTIDLANNHLKLNQRHKEPWKITLVDTGDQTETGGRIKQVAKYVAQDDVFCCTYGDGVTDIDIAKLIAFHQSHGKLATLSAVWPLARFGALNLVNSQVTSFTEKPRGDGNRINGGFFVLSPKVLDYIAGDQTKWEDTPLQRLAQEGQLMAYQHEGFWHPMDTLRDKHYLNELWRKGKAPWHLWKK